MDAGSEVVFGFDTMVRSTPYVPVSVCYSTYQKIRTSVQTFKSYGEFGTTLVQAVPARWRSYESGEVVPR